jgi:sec-independent protein translocase protein TatB
MFSVPHLVVIFIVVLVVFGPHKLPELARGLGKMMAEFRKASTDFKMAFEEEMRTIERQAREAEWKKTQDAATAASPAQEPGAVSDGETTRILPETVSEPEPTIAPVRESVARESASLEVSATNELPVTEGTPPAPNEPAEASPADPGPAEPSNPPTHDHRPSA